MNKKYKELTGFILAGGDSKRMGINKALLKIGNKTIVERSLDLMLNIFENVFLCTNDFEIYRFLNTPMIEDIYKSLGPLSGIHAGLEISETNKNFFLSCDLPLMSEELIRYITEYKTKSDLLITSANRRNQHLCGIYSKSLIRTIEDILRSSNNSINKNGKSSSSIKKMIVNTGAEIIKAEDIPFYNEEIFFNMNTQNDFEIIKKKILG
ncbi:MAG: molybdenum cofactor guanylyltransferase [Ignavibacteriales bacterium]|nr:molybdenum cofactor guanylyltransferase [Ignavibacteriales bacterium]